MGVGTVAARERPPSPKDIAQRAIFRLLRLRTLNIPSLFNDQLNGCSIVQLFFFVVFESFICVVWENNLLCRRRNFALAFFLKWRYNIFATQNRINFRENGLFFFEGIFYPFLGILLLSLVKAQIPTGSMSDTIIPFIWFCVAAIGVCVFRSVNFG